MTPAAPRKSKALIIVLTILLVLLIAVLCVYVGFSIWLSRVDLLLPGVSVSDGNGNFLADLSGCNPRAAENTLENAVRNHLQSSITVRYGDNQTDTISGNLLEYDIDGTIRTALDHQDQYFLLQLPMLWAGILPYSDDVPIQPTGLSEEGRGIIAAAGEKISAAVDDGSAEFTWKINQDNLRITFGSDGQKADLTGWEEKVEQALLQRSSEVQVDTIVDPVHIPTAEELRDLIYREALPPRPDGDGGTLPAQEGLDLDLDTAAYILSGAEPGKTMQIPIIRHQPNPSDVEAYYYQDVLAEWNSTIDGTEDRLFNVVKAAAACNGADLQPGDTFSFLGLVGCPDVAQGYKKAIGYLAGKPVLMGGGGVCQVSSSIYTCAVYADLEIVARANHSYSQEYVQLGMDAAIAWPNLDFQFRNNTPYPMRVVCETEGRNLSVRLLGTRYRDTTVETEIEVLSLNPHGIDYVADETVPQGTTVDSTEYHDGTTVNVYRVIKDAEGNELSRVLENTSKYGTLNQEIRYNPEDIGPWTALATPTPAPTRRPVQTPPPATPVPTETPTEVPTEIPTEAPTEQPIPTGGPAPTDNPMPPGTDVPPAGTDVPPAQTEAPPAQTEAPPANQEQPVPSTEPAPEPTPAENLPTEQPVPPESPEAPPPEAVPAPDTAPAETETPPDPGTDPAATTAEPPAPVASPEVEPPLETPATAPDAGAPETGTGEN